MPEPTSPTSSSPPRRRKDDRAGRNPRRRATDRVRAPASGGLFGRLRLRHKLALALALAALLPVVLASTVALRLVLAGLRSGARSQTERTLMVGVNLLLSHVKEVFEQTVRVSESSGLAETLDQGADAGPLLEKLLARHDEQSFPGLIEVAGADGKVVGRHAIGGGADHWKSLAQSDNAEPVRRALSYERHVTIARVENQLILRSAAPIVDRSFNLRGAVVVSVPLDAAFADRLKAQLSVDVVIYVGGEPRASSFIGATGARDIGLPVPQAMQDQVLRRGQSSFEEIAAHGELYSLGVAPIQNEAGVRLGMLGVAVDEADVLRARSRAWRSVGLGAAAAVLFALLLAAELSRRITRPLAYLHAGAVAVAQGDLEQEMVAHSGDELGDLAVAFSYMIQRLKENQQRLASRMREITTLHEIGRAVSSVLALNEVLGKVTEQVSNVLGAEKTILWLLNDDGTLQPGAAVGITDPRELNALAEQILARRQPVHLEGVADEPQFAAAAPDLKATLIAAPLEEKDQLLGLLVVLRPAGNPFGENDLRLLTTIAAQAATAISNAGLYAALQRSSEELEHKVDERTFELVMANQELEKAINDVRAAQAALVHSERMAGLGVLVAGVAHEVNSPAAAIRGAVDTLADNVSRLSSKARELGEIGIASESRRRFFALVEQLAPTLATVKLESPVQLRRQAKTLTEKLEQHGLQNVDGACRTLVEIGAGDAAYQIAQLAAPGASDPKAAAEAFAAMTAYLEQYAYLFRNAHAIRTAIGRITRIVGALKGYSHLDQARITPTDIHEGIENTLIILQSELRYGITIHRRYGALPAIPHYVDELNQVWTNLIHNAVQALGGKGDIVIETKQVGGDVVVNIEDNGPGIPSEVMPRIFEPFFTTKAKGEGTGLGLPIVRQIVDKHGGRITVESRPGCTRFTVSLPISGPPVRPVSGEAAS